MASASGFKGIGLGGYESIECRRTGDKVGECIYIVSDAGEVQTVTYTGSPMALIVPVSEKAGGASPTGGSGNGNGAVGIAPGKMLVGILGGLVMGAYAVF